jgi:hypothetical protein
VLDLKQPIALVMLVMLHLIQADDKPAEIIAALLDALPSGSYFVASHITMEHEADAIAAGQSTMREAGLSARARNSDEFAPDSRSTAWNRCPGRGARLGVAPGRRRPPARASRGQLLRRSCQKALTRHWLVNKIAAVGRPIR